MATYGEPGKNEFLLPNINGKYSIVVNPTTKVSQIYQRKSQFDFQSIGTLNLSENRLTFDQNAPLTDENKSNLSKNIDIFRRQSVATATIGGATNAEELLLGNSQSDPSSQVPGQSPNDTGSQSGNGTGPVDVGTFATTSESFEKGDSEKYNSDLLRYPREFDKNQDRIIITQKQYISLSQEVLDKNGKFLQDKVGKFGSERFSNDSKQKLLGTVILPMPNDISETNDTAWGEDSLSSLAALIGGAALGGVSELTQGNVPGTIDQIMTLLRKAGGDAATNDVMKQLLTLNAAAQVTQKLGININPEAFRARITGTAINPNLELLFQGPKLRSFGFQFKMIPRSEAEARNIRYILKFFKKGMAPKRSSTSNTPYFLGAPNVFDIKFKGGSGGSSTDLVSIGSIKTCALQRCVVNYTPDGFYSAFMDNTVGSQPIAVTMQLAFTELTPLYNEYYDLSNEDSVGFDETTLSKYQ